MSLDNVLTIILAGGQGERLYPLTKDRAKPAVPFGGIYRIIDFTLSNCLNSGLRKIVVLTQYKSYSLDRHLRLGWNIFNNELGEYIEQIPPQQRISDQWYQGTADAVYQNIYTLEKEHPEMVVILSGDHIYKMDYRSMIRFHQEKKADLTIASMDVPLDEGKRFGVIEANEDNRIIGFHEKPSVPIPSPNNPDAAFASMGIYLFNTKTLVKVIIDDTKKNTNHDFGKNIIPEMIHSKRVYAYPFGDKNNYWRDIGTLDAYWEANRDLVQVSPEFNLYDKDWPIRTHKKQYPPAKTIFNKDLPGERTDMILNSIVSGGCIISGAKVEGCVLSPDVRIDSHSEIYDSVIMESVRIGRNVKIRKAIIDKYVNIPDSMNIGYDREEDSKHFTVTDSGIVVVRKGMHLI
ncbi:MAG: glucose-1-phosphate adenylyltransferase [Candidatus Scalindua rubra]|uniref:Glucose-1-phosphate adenylyltransferase n=1 Tax=Candidatus Scalindua brodae TaxID=237368 RepID=A0A0B0EQ62_9BACT|nr:MAG: glucose-1-phosphate adenylyltransferase [Candidatus Scalindua brodae]MBZ0107439.1 glucose-1-phosphate adenylyltransferase [Candidatus Scalindua rubra]TWU32707.1 Glucose-1-phosphate adenylyltransferase [Candidatus Brocadiaceae bacterium S225]